MFNIFCVNNINRNGLVYTPLFRTHRRGNDKDSIYYLNRETGMGYRIKFNGNEFNEVFIGMTTLEYVISGGYETIEYIKYNSGKFPFFVPKLGLGLFENFDYNPGDGLLRQKLYFPSGLGFWGHRMIKLSDVVEELGKERIVLKKDVPEDLMFHFADCLVEMYDTYDPRDYLNP